ncbi:Crp/Fnr family transcriptional regulator [Wukongibacter baidiensis]|uniref:Crp/Fnr family transcriptional regulator n=1 Tax=Wukongibacter baidiensis TaxID=1723361 RepID=UPI003D7FA01E
MNDHLKECRSYTLPWIDHKSSLQSIKKLLKFGTLRKFSEGDCISRQGEKAETIYYLKTGKVRVVMVTPEGKEKTLWYAISGNIINDVSFFHHLPSNASIIACEDCEVYGFERVIFNRLLIDHPELSEDMLKSMAMRIRVLVHQLDTISFLKPITQICRFLYSFSEKYGKTVGHEIHIHLDITHAEIASINSLHRVTVSKILRRLENEGIIYYNNNGVICIKDIDKLSNYAL